MPKLPFRKVELGSSRIIKIDLHADVFGHDSSKFWASCLKCFACCRKVQQVSLPGKEGPWATYLSRYWGWHEATVPPGWQIARICEESILYSSSAAAWCAERTLPALDSSGMGRCYLAEMKTSMHNFLGCILPLLWIWFFLSNRLIFLTLS